MKKNLVIEALQFIYDNDGEYKKVQLSSFLLKNFSAPSDPLEFDDRAAMSSFLKFLLQSELISYRDENGIFIVIEAGRPIPREEISIFTKITSKGYELLRENRISKMNNLNIIASVIFGTLGVTFAIWGIVSNISQKNIQERFDNLRDENFKIKIENIKLKSELNNKMEYKSKDF